MKKNDQSVGIDPLYNETTATVVEYLETLYQEDEACPEEQKGKMRQRYVNFDGFGTEHASFLLGNKK